LERYQYSPLPGKDYIRTLTLFPGAKDTVPRCHISAVPSDRVEDTYELFPTAGATQTTRSTSSAMEGV
jgi:hypothetical protein